MGGQPAPGFRKCDPMSLPEACFWAVAIIGDGVSTPRVHDWLKHDGRHAERTQVLRALKSASRRQPPLIECTHQGRAGNGDPARWRLTAHGRDYLATC